MPLALVSAQFDSIELVRIAACTPFSEGFGSGEFGIVWRSMMICGWSRRALSFLIILLLAPVSVASAEKRVALVIGNGSYQKIRKLANPYNDATAIAVTLKRLGFEVIEGVDLDKSDLEKRIREFKKSVQGADVAAFFYAGHGVQIAGQNYLIPTDAAVSEMNDVDFETIPFRYVFQPMEFAAKVRIVFLDACRDNPFEGKSDGPAASRSIAVDGGLAPIHSVTGSFVAYAAAPGEVAQDGAGAHSPFTTALLRNIELPGIDLSDLMMNVRREVIEATNSKQVPWDNSSLTQHFFFKSSTVLAGTGTLQQSIPSPATGLGIAEQQNEGPVVVASRSVDERTDLLEFIRLFTRRWNESDLNPDLFAPTVMYYEQGMLLRERVMTIVRDYFERWPRRKFIPIEKSLHVKSMGDDIYEIDFRYQYDVKNRTRHISGTGHYFFTLKRAETSFRILRMDEKVEERNPNKRSPSQG